jgi:hypothetical protein
MSNFKVNTRSLPVRINSKKIPENLLSNLENAESLGWFLLLKSYISIIKLSSVLPSGFESDSLKY